MTNSDVASGPDPVAPLDEQPYPPRFWWLKRIALAWVLVHAAVLGLRIWWGWEAERRWQAAVDRMHETELPSKSASDGSLPDELNLAFVVHAAATKLSLTKENGDFMDMGEFLDGGQLSPDDLRIIDMLRANNAEPLRLMQRAVGLQQCDWRTPSMSRISASGSFSEFRQLAKFLAASAISFHQSGNDELAVSALREVNAVGRAASTESSLMGHFITMAISANGFRTLERIGSKLRIGKGSRNVPGDADPEQVRALIRELSDDGALRDGGVAAMEHDVASVIDLVQSVREYEADPTTLMSMVAPTPSARDRPFIWLVKPAVELDGARLLEKIRMDARAMGLTEWRSTTVARAGSRVDSDPLSIVRPLSEVWRSSQERAVLLHFRALAERRMAAISLAIRWYEVEHGSRPRELAELTPIYLDQLPPDPFAGSGQTFGYLPDADFPRVYSVGADSVDDGGAFLQLESGWTSTDELDLPFFLDGRPDRK